MRVKLLLISILLFLFAGALVAQEEELINVMWDRFERKTTLMPDMDKVGLGIGTERPLFLASMTFHGKKVSLSNLEGVFLCWMTYSKYLDLFDNTNIRCLIDGEPLKLSGTTHPKRVSDAKTLILQSNIETLRMLWDANVIEFRVGGIEFKLQDIEMRMLRELKSKVK